MEKNMDTYGIKNVNFSLIKPGESGWDQSRRDRVERGFDDSELWSLDITIAKFILPRLQRFQQVHVWVPGVVGSDEEWNDILDKMIYWVKTYIELDCSPSQDPDVVVKMAEGKQLFFQYFENLWD